MPKSDHRISIPSFDPAPITPPYGVPSEFACAYEQKKRALIKHLGLETGNRVKDEIALCDHLLQTYFRGFDSAPLKDMADNSLERRCKTALPTFQFICSRIENGKLLSEALLASTSDHGPEAGKRADSVERQVLALRTELRKLVDGFQPEQDIESELYFIGGSAAVALWELVKIVETSVKTADS